MTIIVAKLDKSEVFELVEALYTWCILWHSGQGSDEYATQCEISEVFSPGHGWSETDVENDNLWFSEINQDNYSILWNECKWYLDSYKWDAY